jgi:hypothetical protein
MQIVETGETELPFLFRETVGSFWVRFVISDYVVNNYGNKKANSYDVYHA